MEDTLTPVNTTPAQPAPERGSSFKKVLFALITAVVVIGIAIGGYMYLGGEKAAETNQTGPVAVVGGVEIPRTHYTNSIRSLVQSAAAQGFNINDPAVQTQIQTQAMTALINAELLLQAGTAAGVTVTDAEVQAQYDTIVMALGGAEALQAELTTAALTEEEFRADIHEQLIISTYVEQELAKAGVTVTDAEVTAAYDAEIFPEEGAPTPTLESLRPTIEQNIRTQKEQAVLVALLNSLRATATIDILI